MDFAIEWTEPALLDLEAIVQRDRTRKFREILCKSYRIIYKVNEADQRVEIMTIWHSSRREPRIPKLEGD